MSCMEIIEQFFSGGVTFGRTVVCDISKCGDGIDLIYLKVVLPQLPTDVTYKPYCVYDLISNITLEIGDNQIFNFDSAQLKLFDMINRDTKGFKRSSMTKNNIILYPIDLTYFFKESHCEKYENSNLNLSYNGIRLIDLKDSVKIYITLAENNFNMFSSYNNSLSHLGIIEMSLLVNFIFTKYKEKPIESKSGNWIPNPMSLFYTGTMEKPVIKQQISRWMYVTEKLENSDPAVGLKIRIPVLQSMVSKLYVYSEQLEIVNDFELLMNGITLCIQKTSPDIYQRICTYQNNKYNTNIIAFDFNFNSNIELSINFKVPCHYFVITYMYEYYDNYQMNVSDDHK
jgi:hypothetical protein